MSMEEGQDGLYISTWEYLTVIKGILWRRFFGRVITTFPNTHESTNLWTLKAESQCSDNKSNNDHNAKITHSIG